MRVTTDPSTVDFQCLCRDSAMKAHSSLLKNTRIPDYKAARRTVGHRDPFANPCGCSRKIPGRGWPMQVIG
jgi:hypothetical protein